MTQRAGTGLSEAVRIVRAVADTPLHCDDGKSCVWCGERADDPCKHPKRCTRRRAWEWVRHRDAVRDR